MRLTETRLRQIIREEARRLVEMDGYAPGAAAAEEFSVSSEELSMILDAMESGVDDRLQELQELGYDYDYESSTPEVRKAVFDGWGLEMGPEEVHDTMSIAEAYEEYVGQLVVGIESLTKGSKHARIAGFKYTDQPCVELDTDQGMMTLRLYDLRMY